MMFMLSLICRDIESCPGPALFRNASDFTVLHQNVCGLASKKDILKDFILEKNVKIFGVTETLLQNATPTSLVHIRKKRPQQQRRWSRSIYQREH